MLIRKKKTILSCELSQSCVPPLKLSENGFLQMTTPNCFEHQGADSIWMTKVLHLLVPRTESEIRVPPSTFAILSGH